MNATGISAAIVNKSSSLKRASRSHAKTGLFLTLLRSFFGFVFRACFRRVFLDTLGAFGGFWKSFSINLLVLLDEFDTHL